MSSSTAAMPTQTYLNQNTSFMSWLLTRDHKRIALMYIAGITFFFGIGGFFAALIRLELVTAAGDLLTDETYNKVFTMHGVMMVFFVLIPLVPASLGNFLLPLMLGAKDVAFPKLNLLSFYIYLVGSLFTFTASYLAASTPAGRSTRLSAASLRRQPSFRRPSASSSTGSRAS